MFLKIDQLEPFVIRCSEMIKNIEGKQTPCAEEFDIQTVDEDSYRKSELCD